MSYGQWAGGTYPTGMHSCEILRFSICDSAYSYVGSCVLFFLVKICESAKDQRVNYRTQLQGNSKTNTNIGHIYPSLELLIQAYTMIFSYWGFFFKSPHSSPLPKTYVYIFCLAFLFYLLFSLFFALTNKWLSNALWQ